MKVFAPALMVVATTEKKVPPRHPLSRVNKLNSFAQEWIGNNLSGKQAANWGPKFDRNTARFVRRFELCGYYDATLEHGGPRERRDADCNQEDLDETGICRYDKTNPVRGIQQITKGFTKWAQRYIAECKVQPAKQVDRMNKWLIILKNKLAENQAAGED